MPNSRPSFRLIETAAALCERWCIDLPGLALRLTESQTSGRLWEIVVLEAGLSLNGRNYKPEVLIKSIPIFEDINVFIHKFDPQLADHLPDSVRSAFPAGVAGNMIGMLEHVRFDPDYQSPRQKLQGIKGALLADFHVVDERMQGVFSELHRLGRLDKLGFSIDVEGTVTDGPSVHGLPTKEVESIDRGYALDCVTHPAAGGKIIKPLESVSGTEDFQEQTDLGRAIRKLREKKEMSTDEFGRKIGVDAGTVNAIEEGRIKRPSDDRLKRIATALGVTLAHLKSFIPKSKRKEESQMKEKMIEFIKAFAPHVLEGQELATLTDEQIVGFMGKAVETLAAKLKDKPLGESELQEALHGELMKAVKLLKDGKADEALKVIEAVLAKLPKAGAPYRAPGQMAASTGEGEGEGSSDGAPASGDGKPAEDKAVKKEGGGDPPAAPAKEPVKASSGVTESVSKEVAGLRKTLDEQGKIIKEGQVERSRAVLQAKLSESGLPMASRERIAEQMGGKVFDSSAAEKRIQTEKDYMAKLSEAGEIRGMGPAESGASVGMESSERVSLAFDLLVDPELANLKESKDKYKGIEAFRGLRTAYEHITKDLRVSFNRKDYDARMIEAVTSDFPKVLGDSITRHLLRAYRSFPQNWRKVATVLSLNDFRTQRPIRFGTFDDLAIVAEDAVFTDLNNPTETETTYAPDKRGKKFSITREMILRDDLRQLRRIGPMMARTANRTLEKFVWNLVIGDAGGGGINTDLVSDGTAIYTVGHANLGTAALDSDSLRAALIRLMSQEDEDGNEVQGFLKPWLVAPIELGPTASVLKDSEQKPGSANNDINDNKDAVDLIIIPKAYLGGDANNWFLAARKEEVDALELGFVEGEEEPTVLIQDDPRTGDVFTNERITMKVRHEYGGAITAFQGFDGNIVA